LIRLIKRAFFTPVILAVFYLFFAISPSFATEDLKTGKPPAEQDLRIQEKRISLDVKDADVDDVLLALAKKANIDITLGEGIKGKISIKLADVTFAEALKELCQSNALVYEYLPEKKAYRIISALALNGEKAAGVSKTPAGAVTDFPAQKALEKSHTDGTGSPPGFPMLRSELARQGRDLDRQGRTIYKSGELLVKFKQGATDRQIEELHRSLGSVVLGRINKLRLQRIKLREGLAEKQAIALYTAADIVENAERHVLRYPLLTPNDPEIPKQWALAKMKLPEAWDIARHNPADVVVALIDTGADYTHPDLQDNIWINTPELNGFPGIDDEGNGYIDDVRGWDFGGAFAVDVKADPNYKPDPAPLDIMGHGTHVAGIIAAGVNNGLGIAGINRHAKIMDLKIAADNTDALLDFAIIDAVQYALDKGAKVVNCSFGGSSSSINEEAAFADLRNAGILAVCAGGNDGWDTDIAGNENYPADYNLDNIISVAASDRNDNLASFSNFGATSVDVMAPGVNIYSTVPEGVDTIALIRTGGATPVEYSGIGFLYAGKTGESGITGTAYYSGLGNPGEFPAEVKGNIALIERGTLFFSEKVANAQAAEAAGVIIYNNNNVVDSFDTNGGTLGSAGSWVPAVSITKADGEALRALGAPIVTLINKPAIYAYKSGTSMAAPQVAGLAGLIISQCPSLSYTEIKAAILDTADKIPAVAGKMVSGGRVNASAALSLFLPGDLSGDRRLGLDDAILAQQIITGLSPQISYHCHSSGPVGNGDGPIGLQDAIFILQKLAGLR